MKIFAIILVLLFAPAAGIACSIPNKQSTWNKDELISNTNTIVLAEVVNTKEVGEKSEFTFRTVSVLKGTKSGEFSIALSTVQEKDRGSYKENNFEKHTSSEFWQGANGRLPWYSGSCRPVYMFEKGGQYLLFLESLPNSASAERVNSLNDSWYIYVKKTIPGAL